jgi:hypothetical protein
MQTKMAHIPERTCLGCGRKAAKSELLRIARNREGVVIIDTRQRLPGRGAYVCRSLDCAELLKRKKGLHRGFRHPVPGEIYDSILQYMRDYATQ